MVIPSDHLLRKIADTVDFDFVAELVSDAYCADNGPPSWDPVVLFKVVFLQFLYDLSDRQVEEQVNLHLACKWFVGLQPEETAPDHTVLCPFRSCRQVTRLNMPDFTVPPGHLPRREIARLNPALERAAVSRL